MKKARWALILGPLILILGVYVFSSAILTFWAKRTLNQWEDETLKMSLSSVSVSGFSSPKILIHDLKVELGNRDNSFWLFKVKDISVQPEWKAWFRQELFVSKVSIEGADVSLSEKNDSPSGKNKISKSDIPLFKIGSLSIRNSQFSYSDIDPLGKRETGKLLFENISGDVDSITSDKVKNGKLTGRAQGTFGKGHLSIQLETRILKKPLLVILKSKVENVDLSKIDSYIAPTQGLNIQGEIVKAKAQSELTSEQVSSKVQLLYQNLELTVLNTEERSSFSSGIAEALLQGKICNTNKERGGFDSVHSLQQKTKSKNSITQSLLIGLLDVSLKIACFN